MYRRGTTRDVYMQETQQTGCMNTCAEVHLCEAFLFEPGGPFDRWQVQLDSEITCAECVPSCRSSIDPGYQQLYSINCEYLHVHGTNAALRLLSNTAP